MALLTAKQEKFCINYIECGNATQAAIKAGYKKDNARIVAAENLSKVNIQERLRELYSQAASSKVLSTREKREWIAERLRNPDVKDDVKAKLVDLDNKMEGLYINKTEISGANGGPLEFVWAGDDE